MNGRQVDWLYDSERGCLAQANEKRWDDVQIVCVVLIRFAVWDTGSLDCVVVLYDRSGLEDGKGRVVM
jgi:hypothetical protein